MTYMISRRALWPMGLGLVGLGACTTATVTVSLQTAQTYATEVAHAVMATADAFAASTAATPQLKSEIALLDSTIGAALGAFVSIPNGATTGPALASTIVGTVQKLLSALPVGVVPPAIEAGAQVALAVLAAFVASIPMAVPPVPAALHHAAVKWTPHA